MTMASEAETRALIDRYWAAFQAKDLDAWCACYASDALYEDVPTGFLGSPREFYGEFLEAVPDQTMELHETVIAGSGYGLAWTIRGHLTGDFGPIVGKGQPFELRGSSIGAVEGGLIVKNRDYWDFAGLLVQLGEREIPAE